VRARLDWKYALSLELKDSGFDFSVLSEFRRRLLGGGAENRLMDWMLELFEEKELLKATGRQRTDSTHIIGAVRELNRLEIVGETLHHVLNVLAQVDPAWLRAQVDEGWFRHYGERFSDYRLPKPKAERRKLGLQGRPAQLQPARPSDAHRRRLGARGRRVRLGHRAVRHDDRAGAAFHADDRLVCRVRAQHHHRAPDRGAPLEGPAVRPRRRRDPTRYEKGPDGELRLTSRAETVRRIFELREAGKTLRAIAARLNREGVPTKRGGDWHASTVSYVLKNPKYRGVLRHVIGGEAVEQDRPDLAIG